MAEVGSDMMIRSFWFSHPLASFTVSVIKNGYNLKVRSIQFTNNEVEGLIAPCKLAHDLGFAIRQALDGEPVDFSVYQLDFCGLTEFQQKILFTAQQIPRGQTVSYSKLAEMAGFKNAVRAAGSVMRNNRFPIIIPCHRVIKKNGESGGFCGHIDGELADLKKKLLELERERSE